MTPRAIETSWRGWRFRSRLEARWAVFFTTLGVRWEYEFQGYDLGAAGWYLPDFWLPDLQVYAEVKGAAFTSLEFKQASALVVASEYPLIMLIGSPWYTPYLVIQPCNGDCDWGLRTEPCEGWWLTDYLLDDQYIHTERRFFVSSGYSPGDDLQAQGCWVSEQTQHAYEAALSARFEHGEAPVIQRRAP